MAKLTAKSVQHAKTGRHADGKGLYLLVKPTPEWNSLKKREDTGEALSPKEENILIAKPPGAKSWVLRVQGVLQDSKAGEDGKPSSQRHDFGLGPADLVTLQEAREKAIEGRRMVRAGLHPPTEWKRVQEVIPTFAEAARKYHANIEAGWKNKKHGAQWLQTLETYAIPIIGSKRVDTIDTPAIQSVLLPIWLIVPETARRVRQRIGAVLDFAHGQGWRSGEAPMRAVAKGLPKQAKKGGHFSAMPYAELPTFVAALRGTETSLGRLALQFAILTAARSGEVRGSTWDEIDMNKALWTIPAERMKAGEAHSVPLSEAALAVLREVRAFITGRKGEPIFPGLKGKPLSDMTLAKALRVAGGEGVTVHGMRSTFRDWVAEKMPTVPGDVAEAALAHSIQNKTEAAYRRAKYLDQRRDLMAKWADYLSGEYQNVVR